MVPGSYIHYSEIYQKENSKKYIFIQYPLELQKNETSQAPS